LPLLVAGVAAYNEDHAPAAYNLAVITHAFNAGANFHDPNAPSAIQGELKAHQYKTFASVPSSPENTYF
jgi:hypothetical protein